MNSHGAGGGCGCSEGTRELRRQMELGAAAWVHRGQLVTGPATLQARLGLGWRLPRRAAQPGVDQRCSELGAAEPERLRAPQYSAAQRSF